MNGRTARRLATIRLALAARQLGADMGVHGTTLHGLSDADTNRMVNAFNALAYELEVRTGVSSRKARPVPVDPAQEELFTVERKDDGDVGDVLG